MTDITYYHIKRVMQGKIKMPSAFKPLADWIDTTYDVKTINIVYRTIGQEKKPQLDISLEFEKDRLKFLNKKSYNFNQKKQRAVAEKFKAVIEAHKPLTDKCLFSFFKSKTAYLTKDIEIIFSAFETAAKIEANQCIDRDRLLQAFSESDEIWEIRPLFWSVTFFLYTNEQLKAHQNSQMRQIWTDKYFKMLKKYDEFGYFKRETFTIILDSKENFEKNCGGNWHGYYRY